MRNFAEKPEAPQQAASRKTMVTAPSQLGKTHVADSILHLQYSIGNRAIQQLLQRHAEECDSVLPCITGAPSHFRHDFSRISVTPPNMNPIQTKSSFDKAGDGEIHPIVTGVNQAASAAASALALRARHSPGRSLYRSVLAGDRSPLGKSEGQRMLAHESNHVAQQDTKIRRYREKGAFNFGKMDDATLIEESFNLKRDKETKPWIRLITVEFTSLKTDADGNKYSSGTASVQYYDNKAKLPDFSFTVGGGSRTLGRTDSGTFTVWRIEGIGYNSGTFSGQPGVDFDQTQREGPGNRYSKDLAANMSYAVFYNRGEALHVGPLDSSSHGCVHVDWAPIKKLNYHSVIGLTKVRVKYVK